MVKIGEISVNIESKAVHGDVTARFNTDCTNLAGAWRSWINPYSGSSLKTVAGYAEVPDC